MEEMIIFGLLLQIVALVVLFVRVRGANSHRSHLYSVGRRVPRGKRGSLGDFSWVRPLQRLHRAEVRWPIRAMGEGGFNRSSQHPRFILKPRVARRKPQQASSSRGFSWDGH
jgi:hypothetical protein